MYKKVLINTFISLFLISVYTVIFFENHHSYVFTGEHLKILEAKLGQDIKLKSRGAQYFPFSSYPMYSEVFDPGNLTFVELRGIKKNNEEFYIHGPQYFHPLWRRRAMLETYLSFLAETGTSYDFLRVFWSEYHNKLNSSSWGYTNAPKLKSMQLYLVNWNLADWIEHKKSNPDIKNLYDWKNRKYQPQRILKIATIDDKDISQ